MRTHREEAVQEQQPEVEQDIDGRISMRVELPLRSSSKPRRLWLIPLFLIFCVACVLVVALLTTTRAGHGNDAAMSTRPLTGTPGEFLQPSFSPDGQELAYTWRSSADTHQSIYLQSISSDERRLLADTGSDDYSPVWSPDGSEIAFLHASSDDQPFELIVAKKDNPALRRRVAAICPANDIFRTSPTLSWSPDGHMLATTDCLAENGSPGLTLISVKTGQKLSLTHPPSRTWTTRRCSHQMELRLHSGAAGAMPPMRSMSCHQPEVRSESSPSGRVPSMAWPGAAMERGSSFPRDRRRAWVASGA